MHNEETAPGSFLAIDIGGTHCRVRGSDGLPASEASDGAPEPGEHHKNLDELRKSLKEKIGSRQVAAAVVAVAGPVEEGLATLTNWRGQPVIAIAEEAGDAFDAKLDEKAEVRGREGLVEKLTLVFPTEQAVIVNDLVAAAYGLVDVFGEGADVLSLKRLERPPGFGCEADNTKIGNKSDGRLVIIAPGTGLGTAALVATRDRKGELVFDVVPSEMQHSEIAALNEAHSRLIERWKAATGLPRLRWEDFVSGDGLVMIYRLLGGVEGLDGREIATRARDEQDRASIEALELYYRCIARYAQLAALAYGPTAGVFLAGGSTQANEEFICKRSKTFFWDFHDIGSRAHQDCLRKVPIWLVPTDTVLPGGLWLARRLARRGF